MQKGQKINTWARHIQTAKQQKQNLGSTANIPQLQERGMRGTWDVSSETTPAREESDSMCACVYKAVIVLMDSVVEFRKGVSEMTFFSTMSERIACWERCSHGSKFYFLLKIMTSISLGLEVACAFLLKVSSIHTKEFCPTSVCL